MLTEGHEKPLSNTAVTDALFDLMETSHQQASELSYLSHNVKEDYIIALPIN